MINMHQQNSTHSAYLIIKMVQKVPIGVGVAYHIPLLEMVVLGSDLNL